MSGSAVTSRKGTESVTETNMGKVPVISWTVQQTRVESVAVSGPFSARTGGLCGTAAGGNLGTVAATSAAWLAATDEVQRSAATDKARRLTATDKVKLHAAWTRQWRATRSCDGL